MADNITAKPHQVLQDFFKEVQKGFIEETVTVQSAKFTLKSLNEDEEVWASAYIKGNNPSAFIASRRAPYLACSIRAINGVKLEDLFSYPDGMDSDEKARYERDPAQKQYWFYSQMLFQLAKMPPPVVTELFEAYDALNKRRDAALKGVIAGGPNS